jgi:hypothetical protein
VSRETAQILGIVSLGAAVVSVFMCAAIAPIFAVAAIVLAVLAIRGGAKRMGVVSIVIAAFVLVWSAVMLTKASVSFERAARDLEQAGRYLEQAGRELEQMAGKCWVCKGRGYTDCALCVNGYLSSGDVCPACNGRGTTVCSFCNGTGKSE